MNNSETAASIEEIRRVKRELVKKIRELCQSQKELWQKIPYLALQAQYQNGFNSKLMDAYRFGKFELKVHECWNSSPMKLTVDLATGQLVDDDDDIVLILAEPINFDDSDNVLEVLDAQGLIDGLVKMANKPFKVESNQKWNQEKVIKFRKQVVKDGGLKPVFTADQKYKGSHDQAENKELVEWDTSYP